MRRILITGIMGMVAIGCFSSPVLAEEMVMDLESAVSAALEGNAALAEMRRDAEIARWDALIAFSSYLPHAGASFAAQRYYDNPSLYYDRNYSLDLLVSQSIVDIAQISDIRSAAAWRRAQEQSLRALEQAVIFDTVRFFYGALLARERSEIRNKAYSLAEGELEIARERYAQGEIPYYELLRSETKHLSARAAARTAEAEYIKSLNLLNKFLGPQVDSNFRLEGDFSFEPAEIVLEELLTRIHIDNPGLVAAEYHVEQSRKGVHSARGRFLPRLDLEFRGSTAKYQPRPLGEWDDHWAAYLKVSVPLFEGARRYAQLKRSGEELDKAKIRQKDIFEQSRTDLDSFYRDHVSAKELVVSQEKNLAMSEELYELVRERYLLGESSEIELLDAHLNLIDVESAYNEAKYQYIVSYYGVLLAAGRLDKEVLNAD